MTSIKSYTDLEQSKKLAEILPLESADMYYGYGKYKPEFLPVSDEDVKCLSIPCWSLAALINLLPSSLKDKIGIEYGLSMNKEYIEYANSNLNLFSTYMHTCGNNNLVDACVEMILKHKEENLL